MMAAKTTTEAIKQMTYLAATLEGAADHRGRATARRPGP